MRNMKKYFGPAFFFTSVIVAVLLIRNKPIAEIKEVEKKTPFVKTMILKSQKVNARIYSQGFIRPKSELNILSELNARVEWSQDLVLIKETRSSNWIKEIMNWL